MVYRSAAEQHVSTVWSGSRPSPLHIQHAFACGRQILIATVPLQSRALRVQHGENFISRAVLTWPCAGAEVNAKPNEIDDGAAQQNHLCIHPTVESGAAIQSDGLQV